MSNLDHSGIPSNPVLFEDGIALPPNLLANFGHPQNLWATIERNQLWVGANILGLYTRGTPYKEPGSTLTTQQQIEHANNMRNDENIYTERRNLASFGVFLRASGEDVAEEFKDSFVLDIGSGAGNFSDDIRRQAGAKAVELDFSLAALKALPPVFGNQGSRLVANGMVMPLGDGCFDRTVSMFSTSIHTETMATRLNALTEQLRITKPGGRAFVLPVFANTVLRQQRWQLVQNRRHDPDFFNADMQEYERNLQKEAAMDFVVTALLRNLIVTETVTFTPVLVMQDKPSGTFDMISGIFDMQAPLPLSVAQDLNNQAMASLSRHGFRQLLANVRSAK